MSILLRYKENVYKKVLLSETQYVQLSKFTQYPKFERIMLPGKFLTKATLTRNSIMND